MIKCKCGNERFLTTMVATSEVMVSTDLGYPELIDGTQDKNRISFTGCFVCTDCGSFYMDVEDCEKSSRNITRRCTCGNTRFSAHQRCYMDIIVDSNNDFIRNVGIYESDRAYGPYSCTACGTEYEELEELDKLTSR